jgi:hypothetical protein
MIILWSTRALHMFIINVIVVNYWHEIHDTNACL